MATILDKIIADKRVELEQRKAEKGLAQLKARTRSLRKCRNFYKAVTKPNPRGVNVIAEVKKASPSAGIIRADFDPVAIAKIYQSCGADAISVLTEQKYFQGRLEYINQIKQEIHLPILQKDFIIDKWQLYEARAAGADAILLISEALKPADLMDFMILAAELTMTCLLEVHDADSLLAVRSAIGFPRDKYSVIGINNRNLATMQVDINTTVRLAALIDNKNELIAESGIKTRRDVEKIIAAGARAVLIGQTLCESTDIKKKFTELFG